MLFWVSQRSRSQASQSLDPKCAVHGCNKIAGKATHRVCQHVFFVLVLLVVMLCWYMLALVSLMTVLQTIVVIKNEKQFNAGISPESLWRKRGFKQRYLLIVFIVYRDRSGHWESIQSNLALPPSLSDDWSVAMQALCSTRGSDRHSEVNCVRSFSAASGDK